jgi:hypothetical protein
VLLLVELCCRELQASSGEERSLGRAMMMAREDDAREEAPLYSQARRAPWDVGWVGLAVPGR